MTKIDLPIHDELHPMAAQSLASLDFFRPNMLRGIEDLTPEQLATLPEGYNNDIATLCLHLAATEMVFAHAITGERIGDELKAEYMITAPGGKLPRPEGETVASLTEKLHKSRSYLGEAMAKVTDESLDREFPIGPERTATIRWALALLPIHLALHMGQMQMLKKHI